MVGAIIGDIVGSIYEWENIKTKDFVLFGDECHFTDDTVMTVAIAEALMQGGEADAYIDAMKHFGHLYAHVGYGGYFRRWLAATNTKPYNSWGNGSAMRVSPVGWFFDTLEETEKAAATSAAVTHNHPEGIKGAQSTAAAIFLVRSGRSKAEVKAYIEEKYDYNLSRTLDAIRPEYKFDPSCMGTVPEAITAFLESENFEDAIRNAISLGGDSDTLAAITGSIAEAAYEIPEAIYNKAVSLLEAPLLDVLHRWRERIVKRKA